MKIDTITFTLPYPKNNIKILNTSDNKDYQTILYAMPQELQTPHTYKDTGKGYLGYKTSIVHEDTGVRVSVTFGNEKQRIMYSLDGASINAIEATKEGLLQSLFKSMLQHEARVTRCDIAIDYVNEPFTVADVMRQEENATIKAYTTNPKVYSRHVKNELLPQEQAKLIPETVYYGSPQSMRRLRVYDKFQEYTDKDKTIPEGVKTWIRAELQLRDVYAQQGFILFMSGDINAVKGLFKSFLDIPLWDTETYTMIEPKTRDADTINWLLETCAPSLARVAVDNPTVLSEFMSTVHEKIDAIRLTREIARKRHSVIS